MNRRAFLAASATAAAALRADAQAPYETATVARDDFLPERRSGKLKQSVCRWCYGKMSVDELCSNAAKMGFKSVELLGEKEWSIPAKHGLTCALANGPTSIDRGFNRVENHDKFVKESERLL